MADPSVETVGYGEVEVGFEPGAFGKDGLCIFEFELQACVPGRVHLSSLVSAASRRRIDFPPIVFC